MPLLSAIRYQDPPNASIARQVIANHRCD